MLTKKVGVSTLELGKTSAMHTPEGPRKSGLRTLPQTLGKLTYLAPPQKEQRWRDLEHPLGAKKILWCLNPQS